MCKLVNPRIKEAALWGFHSLIHNVKLARKVRSTLKGKLILHSVQEPDVRVKRIAIRVLTDIVKHDGDMAIKIRDEESIAIIAPLINHEDVLVQSQALAFLAQMMKYGGREAADIVEEENLIPDLVEKMLSREFHVQKNACACICVISLSNEGLIKTILKHEGLDTLMKCLEDRKGLWPVITAIGNMVERYKEFAEFVIDECIVELLLRIYHDSADYLKASIVQTLGIIGSVNNRFEQCEEIVKHGVIPILMEGIDGGSKYLKECSWNALESLVRICSNLKYFSCMLSKNVDIEILNVSSGYYNSAYNNI